MWCSNSAVPPATAGAVPRPSVYVCVCVCVSDVGSKQELPHQRAGNCADNSYMVMACIYVGFRLFCEGVKRIHHPPVINDPAWVLATSFGGLAINLIGIFGFRCGMYIYVCVCVCIHVYTRTTNSRTHAQTLLLWCCARFLCDVGIAHRLTFHIPRALHILLRTPCTCFCTFQARPFV